MTTTTVNQEQVIIAVGAVIASVLSHTVHATRSLTPSQAYDEIVKVVLLAKAP